MLVEDNRNDVYIIQEILKRSGLDAHLQVSSDGDQALKLWDTIENDAEAPCPQLVLLDLNLPKASGVEILARIRRGKRCAAIPVVIVTSSKSPLDLAATQALGASAYFQKTADLTEFMELGRVILELLPTK